MSKHVRALTMALTAALAIMLMASAANALRSISIAGNTNVQASGLLKFGEPRLEPATEITCEVTLLRVLNRVIPKRVGAPIGNITGVAIDIPRCRHGTGIERVEDVRALRQSTATLEVNSRCRVETRLCDVTSPSPPERWLLIYVGILGTLPRITGILFTVERAAFKLLFRDNVFRVRHSCLYEGNVESKAEVEAAGGVSRGAVDLARTRLRLLRRLEGITCPDPASLGGVFNIAPAITVILI